MSRRSAVRIRTKAIVVEISRPSAVAFKQRVEGGERRDEQRFALAPARRQIAAKRRAPLAQIVHLLAALGEAQERNLVEIGVGDRDLEPVAEGFERIVAELLGLMGDHLPFAGRAHAVALDGLGEDDGRLALVVDRGLVGGVDLDRIVPAAGQRPDLGVGPVLDHRRRLGMAAEEVLADIGAVLRLEVLVFAVDAFLHELAQLAARCPWRAARPSRSPTGT